MFDKVFISFVPRFLLSSSQNNAFFRTNDEFNQRYRELLGRKRRWLVDFCNGFSIAKACMGIVRENLPLHEAQITFVSTTLLENDLKQSLNKLFHHKLAGNRL